MIKVGIIGLGFMGLTHFRVYEKLEGVKVVAIADILPRRISGDISDVWGNMGSSAGKRLSMEGITGHADASQLINLPDVDVVDICVPTPSHPQIAIEALQAGKHVLCEKPLARTSAEASLIAEAASRSKGSFMPAQCLRFWPQWAWAKRAIEDKRFGNVLGVTIHRVCAIPGSAWFSDGEQTGGAVLDLHIHDVDFICSLFGQPDSVSSCGYVGRTGALDHVVTQYQFRDVPLVTAEGGWAFDSSYPFCMRYLINFESATADYDSGRKDPLLLYRNGSVEAIDCGASDGYTEEIKYFLSCIREGRRPDAVTAMDSVNCIRVIEAERKSINEGRSVSIPASMA